jgi:4-methylaminobutanoate oxidase (formaldehyde-forming)
MQKLSSLRLEKAFRDFGVDVDETDNPIEAGFGFALRLDKPGGLAQRNVRAAIKVNGTPKRRMLQFLLKCSTPLLHGREIIKLERVPVGSVQVGAYGHTLGAVTGTCFAAPDAPLTAEVVNAGDWAIEIAGREIAAKASLSSLFSPRSVRTNRC